MRKQIFTVMITILVLGIIAQSWGQEEDFWSKRNSLLADYEKWRQQPQMEQSLSKVLADTNITLVNRMYGPGEVVTVQGDYAYVGAGAALLIYNVSNPDRPLLETFTYTLGIIDEIKTRGNVAYVRHGSFITSNVLEIFDISNPINPSKLGSIDTYYMQNFTIDESGQYIYMAYHQANHQPLTLGIIDVSDPANPELVGNYVFNEDGLALHLSSAGDYIYLIKNTSVFENNVRIYKDILQVLDVSDPSNPILVGEYSKDPWSMRDIAADSNYIYLAINNGKGSTPPDKFYLQILDFSDPSSPVEMSSIEISMPGMLSISDHRAYFIKFSSVLGITASIFIGVIDITNPAAPIEIGQYEYKYPYDQTTPKFPVFLNLSFFDDRIYLVGTDLVIIDFSEAPFIRKRGTYHINDSIYDVAVYGNRIYVAQGVDGIKILDTTDPGNPQEIGAYKTGEPIEEIQMLDKYLYFPEYVSGFISQFRLMDLSDPASPVKLGPFKCKEKTITIFAVSDTLYSALGYEGVGIYTLLQPDSLVEIARYATEKYVHDINVSGNFAYIVTTPTERGYIGNDTLRVLDLSNLGDIKELGQCDCAAGNPVVRIGLSVCGSRAYLPVLSRGFMTVDISDPCHPEEIGFCEVNSRQSIHVEAWQNYVFFADNTKVSALDTSNPANFKQAGIFNLQDNYMIGDVFLKGSSENFLYLTISSWCKSNLGLVTLRFDSPTGVAEFLSESTLPDNFSLQQNYPNPFNPSTFISYSLPGSGIHHVSLKIYNLLGREIRTLVNEVQAADSYCVSWDGKNNHRQAVSSGIYFYQLKAGSFTLTKKMSFLR